MLPSGLWLQNIIGIHDQKGSKMKVRAGTRDLYAKYSELLTEFRTETILMIRVKLIKIDTKSRHEYKPQNAI